MHGFTYTLNGTKRRQVTTGEAFALAAEQGCEYRELSAKDAAAVDRVRCCVLCICAHAD